MRFPLPGPPSIWLISLCLITSGCSAIKPESTEFLSSYEGFSQQTGFDDAIIYQGDEMLHSNYDKIVIRDVRIESPKKTEGPPISKEDIDRLEKSFDRILREEFAKHFEVVNRAGRNTLELRVAVVEFKPGNPLVFLAGYAPYLGYASSASGLLGEGNFGAGNAIIQGELLDSRSRKRIYAMIDRWSGGKLDFEGLTRWGHVEKAMRTWSRRVASAIAGVKEKATPTRGSGPRRRGP